MIITKLQVAPVELVVSSESSYVVRLAQHSQNAWVRHVERVESCRVESRRAKWNLGYRTTSLSTIYVTSMKNIYIVTLQLLESDKSARQKKNQKHKQT